MGSVFAKQSRGCGFDTRLVHMPVMLVTNVHPDVMKANANRMLHFFFFLINCNRFIFFHRYFMQVSLIRSIQSYTFCSLQSFVFFKARGSKIKLIGND